MTSSSLSLPGVVRPCPGPTDPVAIPWATVLTFAVVLADADWFWVISLRGAVGAIERTSDPVVSWAQGAGLLVPLFACAVLGALAIAYRRFGPVLQRPRTVVAASLLIVAACTLAGIGALVVSGAYDYRLQIDQLDHTARMGVRCLDSCLTARQDATLALQLKALGAGAVILLVTNLLLIGWMVAIRGGHLTLSRMLPPERTPSESSMDHPAAAAGGRAATARWGTEVQLVLVSAQLGVGTVLAALAAARLLDSSALVLLLLAAAQLAGAQLASARPGRLACMVAILLAAVPPAFWLYVQTAGDGSMPVTGTPRIGLAAGAIGVLELATLLAAGVLLAASSWLRRPPSSPHAGKLSLVGVVAVTAIGLGGSGLAGFDLVGLDHHVPGGHHQALR